MRAAKERRRMEIGHSVDITEVGRVEFSGMVFGSHVVRVLARSDVKIVYLEVDARITCAKTGRGARAVLMRRIARELES